MLAGLMLGGRLGAISVCVYVAIGLAGLPVFTQGGGITYVLKPTFGYLIGFAVGTYVTGAIANKTAAPTFRRKLGRPCDYLSVRHGLLFSNQPSVPRHKHHHSEFVFILLFGNNPRRCYLVSCCRSNRKAAEPNNKEICSVKTKPLPI